MAQDNIKISATYRIDGDLWDVTESREFAPDPAVCEYRFVRHNDGHYEWLIADDVQDAEIELVRDP